MFEIRTLINLALIFLMFSCAVTNNLYVNDPVPAQDGPNLYVGIGTGVRAAMRHLSRQNLEDFSFPAYLKHFR